MRLSRVGVTRLLLLSAALLPAQQSPPARQDTAPLFRANTRLVVCHTTVRDKNQRPVHDLPQTAFTVYEDGTPQPIRAFAYEDVPVSLGLVLDDSSAVAGKRRRVEASSLALVRASNPGDEVFVVNFNDEAFLDLPGHKDFTSDIGEMEKALARPDAQGSPLIRDAVRLSIDHLVSKARHRKRVLVVVAGGRDAGSVCSPEELVRLAHNSGVVIYVIGLLSRSVCDPGAEKGPLQQLAEATGGEAFFSKDPSEVEPICRRIARDIREQYMIGFAPASDKPLNNTFRRITIKVAGPGRIEARTRTGYYASAEPAAASEGSASQ